MIARNLPLIARVLPFTACLIWLACESHFSMNFFISTVHASMVSILGGAESLMLTAYPSAIRTASVSE